MYNTNSLRQLQVVKVWEWLHSYNMICDMFGCKSLLLGQRPPIPCWKDDPQGREEHLWAHPEAGGGVQALDLRRDPGRGKPHPPLRPDCQQNWAGAKQNPLGASWHYLVIYKQLFQSCGVLPKILKNECHRYCAPKSISSRTLGDSSEEEKIVTLSSSLRVWLT